MSIAGGGNPNPAGSLDLQSKLENVCQSAPAALLFVGKSAGMTLLDAELSSEWPLSQWPANG